MAGRSTYNRGSVIAGAVWMFVISLLLFWMPVFGPLLGGIVGGKKAGGVGGAILAVFLPAVLLAILLALSATVLSGFPLIGVVAGAGVFILLIADVGPLLLGAILGGLMA